MQIVPPPSSILNPPFLAKVSIHDGIGIFDGAVASTTKKYRRGHRDLDAFSKHSNKILLRIDLKKAISKEKMPYNKEMDWHRSALFLFHQN